eukprot:2008446-Pyramimonas_sp.AAC.1
MLRAPQWMLWASRTVFVFGTFWASAEVTGGELNSPVVERLNKGVLSVPSKSSANIRGES